MNRWLVESALHSEALDRFLESVPSDSRAAWAANRGRVLGDALAQVGSAAGNVLRKDRDFMEQALDDAEHIATRLGVSDRLITFPEGTIGPFAAPIVQIAIPNWMLPGVEIDATVTISPSDAVRDISLSIGARRFRYSAHGLEIADDAT